jgi:predicted NBD/HSP70 family sugar kinase
MLVALTNLCMEVVDMVSMEHSPNEKLDAIMDRFSLLYAQVLERTGILESEIIGAGVCLGGICNQNTGMMRYNSVYPSWGRDIPIVQKFQERLPEHFALLIANETKLTAMAELYHQPELKDKRFVVILTHGGGISAAYVNKGNVVDGANALAGEIGHMTVDPYSEEVCECGLKGCLEKVISEKVLFRRIQKGLETYRDSTLADFAQNDSFGKGEVVKALATAADSGDELALEVTDYMAKFMGIGIKNILLNVDPEYIIFQGYHKYNGRAYQQALQNYLSQFKYFPDNIGYEIFYDKKEVNELAIVGIGYTLLERYFANETLYF